MQVEVLGRDDGVVVLVLAAPVLVGGETTLHSRLVGDVSVDQRVGDPDVQQRLASIGVEACTSGMIDRPSHDQNGSKIDLI